MLTAHVTISQDLSFGLVALTWPSPSAKSKTAQLLIVILLILLQK